MNIACKMLGRGIPNIGAVFPDYCPFDNLLSTTSSSAISTVAFVLVSSALAIVLTANGIAIAAYIVYRVKNKKKYKKLLSE